LALTDGTEVGRMMSIERTVSTATSFLLVEEVIRDFQP
jgi:hypothetical protein